MLVSFIPMIPIQVRGPVHGKGIMGMCLICVISTLQLMGVVGVTWR